MYAEVLYGMLEESPHHTQTILQEFVSTLYEKRQKHLADDIVHHFEKLLHTEGKVVRPKITTREDGIEIRLGDTLIQNTLEKRKQQLWTKITS